MPKVSIQTIENLQNESSAIGKLNSNFTAIQTIIETLLSRDGRAPNQMISVLDMNARRIINLPVPISPTEPARHGDIQQYVDRAEDAAEAAEESANDAEQAQEIVEDLAEDFFARYLGSFIDPPVLDTLGNPIQPGALYWNLITSQLFAYAVDQVLVGADVVMVGVEPVEQTTWYAIPQATFRSMADVDIPSPTNNQIVIWNAGDSFFNAVDLTALRVIFDNTGTSFASTTVQDALEEIEARVLMDKYDFHVFIKGLLVENDILFRLIPNRAFTIPVSGTGSKASSVVAATGTQVLTLRKNGVQFGTVTFTGSASGVWSIPGTTSFTTTDILTITTGGSVDSAIKHISLSFAATR